MKRSLPILLLALLPLACRTSDAPAARVSGASHAYVDLGDFHRPVSARVPDAQRWVDQGFVLAWAFNHDEAIRCFRQATEIDPGCAIAWWGIAFSNGPHINNPLLPPERAEAAWAALLEARAAAKHASPVERALVEALGARYSADPNAERGPLDEAFADAMREVARAYPEDADVLTWTAEALMDLHPWDLWTNAYEAQPWTAEIVGLLERALELNPRQPGACHLYVHAIEASPHPEKALPAADRLRTLVPGAGHLVHMPAHIDLRLGHYAEAALANERAMEADARHRELFPRDGFYRLYMAHNPHFLSFVEMLSGRRAAALAAAEKMVAGVPPEFIENAGPVVDGYVPIVLHVLVRFGAWEEILRAPEFPPELVVANSIRHYARGVALASLGRLDEAERENEALLATIAKVDDRAVGNNPAKEVLAIARDMLAGEIAFHRGRRDEGIELLRKAAAQEDTLRYDEPPDWMMPVRHALGAALVEAKRWDEAREVYEQDLRRFPENGWSLYGLARALREGGADARKVHDVEQRFARAWARADVELHASCYCQPASGAP